MRSLLFCAPFVLCALVFLGQTPVATGPSGRVNPNPEKPDVQPEPYAPPPMEPIPADTFEMGDHLGTGWFDEMPVHAVHVDAFQMDVFEVTVREYCAFLNASKGQGLIDVIEGAVFKTGTLEPYCDTLSSSMYSRITWDGAAFGVVASKEDHPMTEVSWYGAAAFANWRSKQMQLTPCYDPETWTCLFGAGGYRLPTEAEWELASRGGEHDPYLDYPWGDTIDGSQANYWNSNDRFENKAQPKTTPAGYYNGTQKPAGVDMANGYGLYDMAGNVFEWCNDWYDDLYYEYSDYLNPKGPASGPYGTRVLRGGSWGTYAHILRCAGRRDFAPDSRLFDVGFRLVMQ